MNSSLRRSTALIYGGVEAVLNSGGGIDGGESYGSISTPSRSEFEGSGRCNKAASL